VKKQKAKSKSKSGSAAVKETQNGLPLRVTSNGLIDDTAATAVTGTVAGKAKKNSRSSKHGKTSQSEANDDPPCNSEMTAEKQVEVCDFDHKRSRLN